MGGNENKCIPADLEKGATVNTKRQDGAETILPSTYYDNVIKARLQDSPWLESLNHFMDPKADGFAMDSLNDHRMKHFDIKVMHFFRSQKPGLAIRCYTPEGFESAMQEKQEKRIGTIIIAKGISRAMIEALGTKFELEPDFFADYLLGTEHYRKGHLFSQPPDRAPNFLMEYVRKAPFYTAEFRRPLRIEGREMLIQLRISNTTTPRGVTMIHDDLPDMFSSEKISVYKRMGSKIGIILTDQPLSDCPPAPHISIPVTSLGDQNFGIDRGQHQVSTRREIISWLQDLTDNQVNALFDDSNQLALRPVLKIVEKGGIMFLTHVRYLMQRILVHVCDEKFPDSSTFFLKVVRSLEVHIYIQQRLMCSTLHVAKLRGGDDITEIERDFSYLADDLEFEVKAIKEHVRFFVAEASIQEGKIVGWLSKLATVFLPVSLLATILSINDLGHTKWAILGGLGVPFVFILIFLMFSKRSLAYFSAR